MLIHHLFYLDELRPLYNDIIIHGYGIVNRIGLWSKLCVAIFVFVSGYGLSTKYKGSDKINLRQFYTSRFKKLFFNYWFIWLIFVPIGVFVFQRTFEDAYGSHVAIKCVLDFLGVLNLTGNLGYNPTWWFYSCIIVLYLLFPLLNRLLDKSPLFLTTVSIFLVLLAFLPFVQPYSRYLMPFLAGMLMARKPQLFKAIGTTECIIAFILLAVMRVNCGNLTVIVDTLLCVSIAMFLYRVEVPRLIEKLFASLGKHSMNIFLFHSFIFYQWFRDIIYISHNPLLIFLSLIIPCYLISVVIEFVKEKIGFYMLVR